MNKQSFIAGQASGQHAAKKYYLGLDLGGTNIVAGVVDEDYNILSKKSIPANAGRPVEEVTRDMAEVGKEAVRLAGLQLVVERTFSWPENFRRLAKDYEYRVSTGEAMIQLAFIVLMLNRIYSQ
jgi:molecular chaperone DnaK (HSP70)